jgi:hypothetical protein
MSWSLGTQFCLELAFGVLAGLAYVARAPLGALFFRRMGATALAALLVAVALPRLAAGASWSDPRWFGAGLGAALFPFYSGPVRARTRRAALFGAAAGCAVSIALEVRGAPAVEGPLTWTLASASALATGLVGGGVGLAMVFGHWYLTVPSLEVGWLVRLNRSTMLAMAGSLAILASSLAVFREPLRARGVDLLGPWPLFHVGTRVAVGLVVPLVFGWMVAQSLRWRNTRSATGILYASTVLVLIGTAASIFLQDSYGAPL